MNKLFLAFTLMSIPLISSALELSACGFGGNAFASFVGLGNDTRRAAPGDERSLDVIGNRHNGKVLSYSKDDPVLIVDLRLNTHLPVEVPDKDILLKSSNFLVPEHRLAADKGIAVSRKITTSDGRTYKALQITPDRQVLLDADGRLCNKLLAVSSNSWVLGTLSQDPDAVSFESRTITKTIGIGSLRIIFTGVQAGAITFQELWVDGANILTSTSRKFDQFSSTVRIGPFDFQILSVQDGKISLKYDIQDQFPILSPSNMGLQLGKLRGTP